MQFASSSMFKFTLLWVLIIQEIGVQGARLNEKTDKQEGSMSKIVGGENAPVDEYPWFARIVWRNSGGWIGCGGILVAPEYVLTAAHCVPPVASWSAIHIAVDIGVVCPNHPNNCGEPHQRINVESITAHPSYNDNTYDNDYALIKLESRANADPAAMDQGKYVDNYSSQKRDLWAVGFGNVSSGGSIASQLRHVELAYIPMNECNSDLRYNGRLTDNMMCAQDHGQDSCQGDSGGPLYDKENNVLVGIVSFGIGCANDRYPGVYAKISARWDWIASNICGSHSAPHPSFCSILNASTSSPSSTPTLALSTPPTSLINATTSSPSSTSTLAPSTPPTSSNSCSSQEFLGRTVYFPLYENCFRLGLFPGGLIEVDTSDPTCSNAEFNSDVVYSAFSYSDRSHTYFENVNGTLPFEGTLDFNEDSSVTDLVAIPNAVSGGTFDLTLNVPSCDMGPTYPCLNESMLGSTVFTPVVGICLKIELSEGGTVTGDTSDPTCSKSEQGDHTASIVLSTFSFARGNRFYYETNGNDGWSGFIELNEDSSFSEAQVVQQNRLNGGLREYEFSLTYPSCENVHSERRIVLR